MKRSFNIKKEQVQKWVLVFIMNLFVGGQLFAQDPNWSVNQNDFEYTMTFLAFITIDGNRLVNTNDKVAVFVGNEVRGTTNLTYVESQDGYYAFLTAFSNAANETLTVKVYDSQNDQVRDIPGQINFVINEHQGTLFQAVSWADPVLSSDAEINSFAFDGITTLQETVEDQNITIVIEDTFDITTLTPVFEVSAGATLFKEAVSQTSGQDMVDFTNEVTYQVRSEDQSTLSTWTVRVTQIPDDIIYRKRDEVCYQKGAIKVEGSQDGVQVVLLQDGSQLAMQTINNNEVVFENLDEGTYTVQVGNLSKEITVNYKID